jgi:UPF0755 protein
VRRGVLNVAILAVGLSIFHGCSQTPNSELVTLNVERGATIRSIAERLKTHGVISNQWLFVWVGRLNGVTPKPGLYQIPASSSISEVWDVLRQGPTRARITIPEGWTAKQIAQRLEAANVMPAAVFLEKVEKESLEGYLFPDTYLFDQGSSVDVVVNTLRKRFEHMRPADFGTRAKALRLTERQLVILASIVEREARVRDEMPMIAGVYLNRLRKGMKLQADPTVQYALGQWTSRLLYKDLEVDSPYNTYRHKGLPPGPIGNPGVAALEAAVHPAQTDMLFFVAQGDGTHRFSKSYEDHLNVQRKKR